MSYFCELHYVGAARGAASNVSRLGCRIKNEFRNGAISMKSILQGIAILSAAALIAGCDSNSGGASSVGVTPPTPQTSSTGSAVKGLINGATVTASDTGGTRQIGSSTVLNGTYNIAYDTAFAPFVDPIVITVTGGSALCDYENPDNSGNDCQQLDGTFVAFGQSYDITGTVLRSNISAGTAGGVSNASPLYEIAASKAASPLTAASVTQTNLAISGLIEAVSGISLGGVDFTTIAPSDLTATGNVTDSPAQLAIAAFGAAVIGAQGAGESLTATIARLAAGITVDPATGNITSTGTALATFANAYAAGLAVAAKRRPNASVAAAAATATSNAAAFTAIGSGAVTVSPSSTPGSTAPVDTARAFVTKLGAVIGDVIATTGAQGAGGATALSATETFAAELDAVARLTSGNATKAFAQLDAAILAASTGLENGASVTNDATTEDGILFTLAKGADGALTLSGVSSAWPLVATADNQVVVTGSGTATGASFTLSDVTVTSDSGTTLAQTFTGSASYTVTAATDTAAATYSATFAGNVIGADADPSFAVNLSVTDEPVTVLSTSTRGAYTASFVFTSTTAADVTVAMSGTVGATAQTITFTTPSGVITSTVTRAAGAGDNGAGDQVTLTDGNASLALVALTNGSLPSTGTIGTISVGTTEGVATLGSNGFVTYDDGSIQILPALIFPDPQ
jgi:hypothetical protein